MFREAYREFEERVGTTPERRGTKTEIVRDAIARMLNEFTIGDLQGKCPGVGVEMIRKVLKNERLAGNIECLGRGRDARWRRLLPQQGVEKPRLRP